MNKNTTRTRTRSMPKTRSLLSLSWCSSVRSWRCGERAEFQLLMTVRVSQLSSLLQCSCLWRSKWTGKLLCCGTAGKCTNVLGITICFVWIAAEISLANSRFQYTHFSICIYFLTYFTSCSCGFRFIYTGKEQECSFPTVCLVRYCCCHRRQHTRD